MHANEFRFVWLVRKARKREENKFFFLEEENKILNI